MTTADKFIQARQEIHAQFRAGEISERTRDDALRMVDADESQARMLAALPAFPQYGFYVKTGLAGYGPDLDESDMPYISWEDIASAIATEFRDMAEFNGQGASATAETAETLYNDPVADARITALEYYRDAWKTLKLAEELDNMAMNFDNLAKTEDVAPLYQGRPELRHARIWNLITEQFPYDVSYNSRLYVWECEEEPDTEED